MIKEGLTQLYFLRYDDCHVKKILEECRFKHFSYGGAKRYDSRRNLSDDMEGAGQIL